MQKCVTKMCNNPWRLSDTNKHRDKNRLYTPRFIVPSNFNLVKGFILEIVYMQGDINGLGIGGRHFNSLIYLN